MSPLSTAATDIDEIILLRKAKRINSNVRAAYATASNRKLKRQQYVEYLQANPFSVDMFKRFASHIEKLIKNETPDERDVLAHGYF